MKALSASIVVLPGSLDLFAATHGPTNNAEAMYWIGLLVTLAGIGGWAYSLKLER
jgi:hypothetical protein